MPLVAVHNSTAQPQVVNDAGRILASGEFDAVEADDRTDRLLKAGDLVRVSGDPDTAGTDESAAAALRAVTADKASAAKAAADKAPKAALKTPRPVDEGN